MSILFCPNFNEPFYKVLKDTLGEDAVYLFQSRLADDDTIFWKDKTITATYNKDSFIIRNENGDEWNFKNEVTLYNSKYKDINDYAKELGLSNIENKDLGEFIKENETMVSPFTKSLFLKLDELNKTNILLSNKVSEDYANTVGYYNYNTHHIVLPLKQIIYDSLAKNKVNKDNFIKYFQNVLAHEVIHRFTYSRLYLYENILKGAIDEKDVKYKFSNIEKKALDSIINIYNYLKDNVNNKDLNLYGFKNVNEFIAEYLVDKKLRE